MGDGAGLLHGAWGGRQHEEAFACWIVVSSAMSLQSCGPHCEKSKERNQQQRSNEMSNPRLATAVETVCINA